MQVLAVDVLEAARLTSLSPHTMEAQLKAMEARSGTTRR